MEFTASSVSEAWQASIPLLLADGKWVPTERGMRALELQNVLFCVTHPTLNPPLPQKYGFAPDYVATHIGTFHENYSGTSIRTRLYQYNGQFNQIDAVVRKLKENWYSRRAVVVAWEPVTDTESPRPPCPIALTFLVRDKRLLLTAVLRSNDAWLATIPDMIALTQVQHEVSCQLALGMGAYTHLAISYHIYQPDIADARTHFS
jgi:thymidylate synthase